MFFERIYRLRHTLAFRLTLWYAGIFTLSLFTAFFLLYFSIASITQKRTDRELSTEIAEFSSLLASNGMAAVIENINIEAASNGVDEMLLRVMTADGREIASSNKESWEGISANEDAVKRLAAGEDRVFATERHPRHRHGIRMVYGALGQGTILQIAQSLEDEEELLELVRRIFVITLIALMLPAALIGWFMARRALQGVEEVTRTATEISTGTLELRVPVKARGDEIDRLATTFNSMLDRIHALITGMREMTDNIAHDLRSPITRIRGIAEMTLTTPGSLEDHQTMAANTIEECDRLLEMINTMLDITEVEAGAARLKVEDVDVSALVREACELFQPLADDKGIALVTSAPAGALIKGDNQRLQRMVANLLDNALKYTDAGGSVTVSVREGGDRVVISVSDTGIGISEKDLPHIFKRFYRCDQSRSQAGTGLGLCLAQAIASAHGGAITVVSSLDKGSTFSVTLSRQLRPH